MRPTDARVRAQLGVARRPLTAVLACGLLTGLAVIGQAFSLATLVVAAVHGDDLVVPALFVAAAYATRIAASAGSDVAAARAASLVAADMRARILGSTLAGSAPAVSDGELTALATRGVDAAQPYLTRYVPALGLAVALPPLTIAAILSQDLLSAVIVAATLPLIPVFGALVGLATRDRAREQWRAMESLAGHFVDIMRGLPTLVAFRRADAQVTNIRGVTDRYRRATARTLRVAFASSAVLELVATLSVALLAVVIGVRLAAGHLDLYTGLVVLLLAPEAYWPLRRVGAEFHASAEGLATFEQMASYPAAGVPDAELPGIPQHRMLIARDVTVAYPGRDRAALGPVTLAAAPGSLTVITGPSGSGKSTALALLAGLASPASGSVTCAGRPLDADEWRRSVSWVPQRPSFDPGSVAENLRLAAPAADDAALWRALDKVALAERVRLLGGLDAHVGEDGHRFSAGERARLAIARTIVAERPWVMLDEPTAHLDPVTSQVIRDAVVDLAEVSGVIVVAHDPAMAGIADRTIEIEHPSDPAQPSVAPTASVQPARPAGAVPAAGDADADTKPGFLLSTTLGILASACGVALTATAGWLIVRAAERPAMLTMLVAIVGVRTFGIGRPVLRYAERLRSHDNALRLLAERRVQVYRRLVPLTPGRLGKRRGDVLASVVDDVDAVMDRSLRIRLPLISHAAVTVLAGSVAVLLDPVAGIVVTTAAAISAGLGYLIVRHGTLDAEHTLVGSRGEVSDLILDVAYRAQELRMWQAGDRVAGRLDGISARAAAASARAAVSTAAARAVCLAGVALGVVGVAWAGRFALADSTLSAPQYALLLLLPVALGDTALAVVDAGALVARVDSAEARLDHYATLRPAVSEPANPVHRGTDQDVVVRGARIGWDSVPVGDEVNLTVGRGETVAVLGPSGCGKSTLAASLIRFIDPIEGSISLGGENLADLRLGDVRESVGLVADDPHVFATTVAENVRFARPAATDAEVDAALRTVRLGDWLDGLTQGLDTWIGDGHGSLSGGERARLGLARSILADQPTLVLDEPVAHLDPGTAQLLARDLLVASGGRTVVWIGHSRVGLDLVDRIVEMAGALVSRDTHVSGYYYE